jgi:putative ABC transport system permease protein
MTRYFLRAFLGQVRHGKVLFFLSLLGVAIGVSSVLSIQIINQNALSAFRGSVAAITGDADLSVVSRTPTLDESLYPVVLGTRGVAAAWPLTRVQVSVAGTRQEDSPLFLEIIGSDLFAPAERPALDFTSESEAGDAGFTFLHEALTIPGWVAVSPSLARQQGWETGDTVQVSSGARRAALVIGALVDFQSISPFASRKLALMDIAQIQSLLGRPGEIQEIQVRVEEGSEVESVAAAIRNALGTEVLVQTPETREAKVKGLLSAFRLNLTALSLISLFVGIFLIYSSTQTGLVRRRPEFGLLRSLGATRGQILGLILTEVVLLGTLGTALGIPLGYFAAQINVDQVSATMTSIYLLSEIERLELSGSLYLIAVAVGVGGALLGGILPALDIGRRDTRSLLVSFTLRETVTRLAPRLAMLGIMLMIGTLIWFFSGGRDMQTGGFMLGFALLVILPLFTPQLIVSVCGPIRPRGFNLAYSLKTLVLKVQTTSFAVAALGVAVSMLIGITLLIGSFRYTLATWLESSIQADVYITTESWAREGRLATLTPRLQEELRSQPGTRGSELLRQFWVYAGDRRISLAGVEFDRDARSRNMPLYRGEQEEVWRGLAGGGVVLGEPLARKTGLDLGDSLVVATPGGDTYFPVVGLVYDYSEAGSALIDLGVMDSVFGSAPINNMALFVDPDQDVEAFVDRLRLRFEDYPLLIRSNRDLRGEVMRLFDQTFAITRLLQLMALLVAASGISLTLLVLARERVAELALYRSLGALRRQIFRVFVGEGLAIGVLGLLLGLGGGVALASILIYIINPAFFGWTIRPSWPWTEVVQEMVTILVVAMIAGVYPALRASRVPVRELSRDDL